GQAAFALRVRIPSWLAQSPGVLLNGAALDQAAPRGSWLTVQRTWRTGDTLDVGLPMRLAMSPTPDDPTVQAVTFGPIVLAGAYGSQALGHLPRLDPTSVQPTAPAATTFAGTADGQNVTLLPISRTHHQHYTVYW